MSRVTFRSIFIQREAHDDTYDLVFRDLLEQLRHGDALAGAAGQRGEGLCERLRLVRKGEPDAALAPVDSQNPA